MGRDVPSDRILRFRLSERLLHWAIAFPFLVCFSTALVLVFYYNPLPSRPYRALFSLVHRISGLCLIGLPVLVLLGGIRDLRTHWENIKTGWIWSLGDVKWLMLMPFAMLSRRVRLPEEGKFNAGEKLNFMWVMASWPLYGLTGALIWMGNDLERWVGVPLRLGVLPWIVHFSLAAVSTLLVSGHVFMAVINPASRVGLTGMFSGYVSRHWASHHYRRWFRERFAAVVDASAAPDESGPVPEPGRTFEVSATRLAAMAPRPLPGVPLVVRPLPGVPLTGNPSPAAPPEWEPDTDVDAQPWLGLEAAPAAPAAPATPAAVEREAAVVASTPAAARGAPHHEAGDLGLLEMMRTGAHSVAVSTIEHVKSGAYVAARTGVALTPAAVAFVVIFAGGLLGGGVCAVRLTARTYLYLGEDTPLLVDASAHGLPLSGGPLPRGARLTRVGVTGHFSRVTDPLGRTGYVRTSALVGAQPRGDAKLPAGASTMAPATAPATETGAAPATVPATTPVVVAAGRPGAVDPEHRAAATAPGAATASLAQPPTPTIVESIPARASQAPTKARGGKARRRGTTRRAAHR